MTPARWKITSASAAQREQFRLAVVEVVGQQPHVVAASQVRRQVAADESLGAGNEDGFQGARSPLPLGEGKGERCAGDPVSALGLRGLSLVSPAFDSTSCWASAANCSWMYGSFKQQLDHLVDPQSPHVMRVVVLDLGQMALAVGEVLGIVEIAHVGRHAVVVSQVTARTISSRVSSVS